MCGITGCIGIPDRQAGEACIRQMTDRLAHRGPDAAGYFVEASVALGHRRLSIIDLSEAANQPMTDASGRYVMIFNGEIYNYQSIKAEISNYPFHTNSDSEVVLAAYIQWGADFLQKLNGMFALSIWDKKDRRLFVARDRLGIKPFYYFQDQTHFIFASEIRALLASQRVPKKINRFAIVDFLSYYTTHAPHTIVENVRQLMPGAYGVWENGQFKETIYWDIANQQKEGAVGADYGAIKAEVKTKLFEAVERRLLSDVPLGAFLSGGIDSSAIVAIMSELRDQAANTFSVVFEEKKYDESTYSSLIAQKYKTNHTAILLKPSDFLAELPEALRAMDSPTGDGVNTYVVSKVTKQAGITVALSGLGGDELFAGYPVFQQYPSLYQKQWLWSFPTSLRQGLAQVLKKVFYNNKIDRFAELLSAPGKEISEVYPIFRKAMIGQEIAALGNSLPEEFNAVARIVAQQKANKQDLPLLSKISIAEIASYTQNVILKDTDQMSMSQALEVRVPFFDHELVEYALQIPDRYKSTAYPKKLLVESLGALLPEEVVHRKKMGFSFPWDNWLRKDLKAFCERNIQRLAERQVFEASTILAYWQRFLAGDKKMPWLKIWILVVLEEWLYQNELD